MQHLERVDRPTAGAPPRGRRRNAASRRAARAPSRAHAKHTVPTGFSRRAARRARRAAHRDRDLRVARVQRAFDHFAHDRSETAPWRSSVSPLHAEHFALGNIGVGDEAAVEPRRAARAPS